LHHFLPIAAASEGAEGRERVNANWMRDWTSSGRCILRRRKVLFVTGLSLSMIEAVPAKE
jgi:hypothetical protein